MAHRLVLVTVHTRCECLAPAVMIERHYLGERLLSKMAFVTFIKKLNMNIL